jgi:hypothetical protein
VDDGPDDEAVDGGVDNDAGDGPAGDDVPGAGSSAHAVPAILANPTSAKTAQLLVSAERNTLRPHNIPSNITPHYPRLVRLIPQATKSRFRKLSLRMTKTLLRQRHYLF